MPTDEERWKEVMIESGQVPDDNGIWHYNPQAIENPYGWEQQMSDHLIRSNTSRQYYYKCIRNAIRAD